MLASLEGSARRHVPAGFEGWTKDASRDAVAERFRYADFNLPFAFMTEIALEAERMDRHPNVYNRVSVLLSAQACACERDTGSARFNDTLAT